jgi:glyoxylase-like metal-dependent hydrolase (beta-lactamase superfamily II)
MMLNLPATENIRIFFDQQSHTFSYLLINPETKCCALIDPVLNYDDTIFDLKTACVNLLESIHFSNTPSHVTHQAIQRVNYQNILCHTNTKQLDQIIAFIKTKQLQLIWILETHLHADHLTGAYYLQEKLGAEIAIGQGVQALWRMYSANNQIITAKLFEKTNYLLQDQQVLPLGNLEIKVLSTPGHTPACLSYYFNQSIFVGDALLMPWWGTGRTDSLGADAHTLYQSIQKILAYPADTCLYSCHDYPFDFSNTPFENLKPPIHTKHLLWLKNMGFDHAKYGVQCLSTVAEQKLYNQMIDNQTLYIQKRQEKDDQKPKPKLFELATVFNLNLAYTNQI